MKNNNNYILREYQKRAKEKVLDSIRNKFRQKVNSEDNNSTFKSADLIEMATGSGKTLVSGEIISHIIEVKDRLGEKLDFGGLNILVLTNRIDGINQFYEDWLLGRGNKKPIFSEKILSKVEAKIFHSKGENLDEYENFSENDKHKLFFATYQTADLKNLKEKLKDIDVIIIDEAHNVGFEENNFRETLKDLEKNGRNGYKPEILALSATPDNITKENFGESIFTFGLPEYLVSEYSPNVNYQVITGTSVKNDEIKKLEKYINKTKREKNLYLKNKMIKNIENYLENILQNSPDLAPLCSDILERISKDGEIKKSIIFVNNIEEANDITKMLNTISQTNSAIAYHSKNDEKNIFEDFSGDGETKILVVVNKLNESVDLPIVENIVFYRNTSSEKIFFQQFGRGLRGKGTVNYFDYVGSLKNFSWIGNIYKEYYEKSKTDKNTLDEENSNEKFFISGGKLESQNFEIDLYDLSRRISNFIDKKEPTKKDILDVFKVDLTQEDVIKFFKNKNLNYWKKLNFKEKRNLEIKGNYLKDILNLFGIKGNPIRDNDIWLDLLEIIFDTIIERNEITRKDVINYLEEKDLSFWLNLDKEDLKELKIKGNNFKDILNLFGIELYQENYEKAWIDLLEKKFTEVNEINEIRKKRIINSFKEKGLEYLLNLDIFKLENLYYVLNLFGIEGTSNTIQELWLKLLKEIFGEEDFNIALNIKKEKEKEKEVKIEKRIKEKILERVKVIEFFKEKGLNYWISLDRKERLNLIINGEDLYYISKLFGIKGDLVNYKIIWFKLLGKVFEIKVDEIIKEVEREKELERKKIIDFFKKEDINYWINLDGKEKQNIKINGKGLIAISTLFGIEQDPINNRNIWYEFLGKVFNTQIEIEKLTQEKVIEFFKEKDINYWINLDRKEKLNLKINGKGLVAISSLFGIEGNPISNNEIWYEFLDKIFNTQIKIEKLTQEKVIKFFKEKDLEFWINLTIKEKLNLKINGKGLFAISKLFGIEGNPINNRNIWYEFLGKIFNTQIETQEKIIEFFKKEDINYWIKLDKKEKLNIKINGKGLIAISSLFGIEGDPIKNRNIWYEFIGKIFNTNIKEEIIKSFREKDINYWINLDRKEKQNIKINGKGLVAISSLFGIEGNPITNKNTWYELLGKIFGIKVYEIIKEVEREKELERKKIIEFFKEKDINYWMNLIEKEKYSLKINGKGLFAISSLFGIEGNPITNKNTWHEFLGKIFGIKVDEAIKEIKKEKEIEKELKRKKIIDFFKEKDLKFWINLTEKEKYSLKINGERLIIISSLFGIKGDPINNNEIWYEFLGKVFEIKVDEVIKEIKRKKELERKKIIDFFKEKDLNYWINLNRKEKLNLKINGKGLVAISSLFGIKGDPRNNNEIWYELLDKIFKEEK